MRQHSDHSDVGGLDTTQSGLNPARVPDNRLGSITMQPHQNLVAGSFVTLTFDYIAGAIKLQPGATFRLGTPCTGWGEPLIARSRYWYRWQPAAFDRVNTEVRLYTTSKAEVELQVEEKMLRYTPAGGAWRWWIVVRLKQGCLMPSERMRIIYGATQWGEDGVQVQKFPERNAHFLALLDHAGTGEYVEIPNSPFEFDVTAGKAARFVLTAPSIVEAGKSYPVKLAITDSYWSPALSDLNNEIELSGAATPHQVRVSDQDASYAQIPGIEFIPGRYTRLQVSDPMSGLQAHGNPVLCRAQPVGEKIYWGDLHTQSHYHGPGGWSVGAPDELYRYAREITHLDFVALTDDVAPLSPGWGEIQQAAINHYAPGEFVTFKAFEFCSKRYGHRNTIYADTELEDNYDPDIFNGTIDQFWAHFENKNVIQIPHHTFVWTNWKKHHSQLEPLVEIYSTWGRSEYHANQPWNDSEVPGGGAQGGLGLGYRLGIIGSSDTHTGMPGRSVPMGERFHNMQREKVVWLPCMLPS